MKMNNRRLEDLIIIVLCVFFLIFFTVINRKAPGSVDGFKVVTSTTPAMIEEMDYAIKNRQFLAITAWKPHWMNARLPIKYLDDPEQVFGGAENIHTIARKGFEEDYPEVAKFLRQFKWETKDLDSLSLKSNDSNGDYERAAREWLRENPELAASFLQGVRAQTGATIKLVNTGYSNELATNEMLKILLEEHLNCKVTMISTTIPIAFEALSNGTQDVMVTVWLPSYHKTEFARIRDHVVDLGANLHGTGMGIAVPEYVPVNSIAELKKYQKEFKGEIIGNEPGQGILLLAKQALEVYGLTAAKK